MRRKLSIRVQRFIVVDKRGLLHSPFGRFLRLVGVAYSKTIPTNTAKMTKKARDYFLQSRALLSPRR